MLVFAIQCFELLSDGRKKSCLASIIVKIQSHCKKKKNNDSVVFFPPVGIGGLSLEFWLLK
jgi:molybdopterin converting factor small subunit